MNDYEVLGVEAGRRQRATAKATATAPSTGTQSGSFSTAGKGNVDEEEATIAAEEEVVAAGSTGGGGGGTRTRVANNDWEEYADLIEDTDDLK